MKKINILTFAAAVLCAALMLVSCSDSSAEVSDSDISASDIPQVSSEIRLTAEESVTVTVDEQELADCFLLKSLWYGETFENKSSLNQLMMEKYMSEDSVIPQAFNKSIIRFIFNGDEKSSSVKLTQHANTFTANTGIPYNIKEIELQQDENGGYFFEMDFDGFAMYYYQLDCEWDNGNSAQYVFALEKGKKQ